jgi:hypothetical protein
VTLLSSPSASSRCGGDSAYNSDVAGDDRLPQNYYKHSSGVNSLRKDTRAAGARQIVAGANRVDEQLRNTTEDTGTDRDKSIGKF